MRGLIRLVNLFLETLAWAVYRLRPVCYAALDAACIWAAVWCFRKDLVFLGAMAAVLAVYGLVESARLLSGFKVKDPVEDFHAGM